MQRLASSKGQKLACQLFAALHCSQRHIHPLLQLIVLLFAAQYLETSLQHGQQVVEIVGNPAGQLTERLHLLCLTKFGLREVSSIHLAPEAPRRRTPAPARNRAPLDLPGREPRHAKERKRGWHRKERIVDEVAAPRRENPLHWDAKRDIERITLD